MSEISSFRFWCQKVLPAVYDDSLSYYELLCKVVAKLNEVINSQNGTNDHVTELAQQFEQLKNDLQGTIESEAEKIVDNYVKTNNLVKSVNGITAVGETGNVTLQASDVGAIANVNDSVKENNIQNGAVTADKLAPGAVPVKSVNGKTGEVQITASEINALPNTAGSVGTTNLQDGAVTGDKIANGAVVSSKIGNQAVLTGNIADKAVSAFKIDNGAVSSPKIADGAVSTDKIADGAVTGDKLSDGAVPVKSVNTKTGEVVLSADDVGAIANTDGAVTTPKMADYSVTNPKIAKGTITPDRMADQGAENAGKLLKIGADGKPAWLSGESTVTAGVESVNGKDGVVILYADDVGAIKANANALKSSDINVGTESQFLAGLREIYPGASPESPTRLYYYGFPPLDFTGSSLKPVPGLPSAYIWNSTTLSGIRFTNLPLSTFMAAPDGTTISFNKEHPVYTLFVKSINQKTGDVTLTVDDIDGALKEVAPSDMLTGDSVVGAYLFLAPANGETDAFQKVAKLPENMLPTDIDGSVLKDGTVGTTKLVGLSVTTEKIAAGAVTGPKLGANSVSTSCVQDGAVTLAKLNQPGAAESGKVLGVSGTGQWELQALSKGGEWEEIPATSLIDGATVHCRIQPGTGWLWFSIESDSGENITIGGASSSGTSKSTVWGSINFNAVNSPVPANGTSSSTDSYSVPSASLHVAYVSKVTISGTSIKKLNYKTGTSTMAPFLSVRRDNTGVTLFGMNNGTTTIQSAIHAEFYVPYWFDNRTTDGSEAYPRT
nr:MAG TPA: hypothetical protein [Caudoviricetes sp.]